MPIALFDAARARDLLHECLGCAPDSREGVADLIRREVSARGGSPRHLVIKQILQLVAPTAVLDPALVEEVCDELEREGDILTGGGGRLYPAPVRIVRLDADVVRFVCAISDARLLSTVPGRWTRRGTRRECRPQQPLDDTVRSLAAVYIGPEVWARLDHAPFADDEWLRGLDARLSWTPEPAGSREHDGPLNWRGLDLSEPDAGPHWSTAEPAKLWRAHDRWRRWIYAWTAGAHPSAGPFVSLDHDEAARTAYALARSAQGGWRVTLRRHGPTAELAVPGWLPRAEYRYLTTVAERAAGSVGVWTVPDARIAEAAQMLTERLGLIIDSDEAPALAPVDPVATLDPTQVVLDPALAQFPTLETLQNLSVRATNVIQNHGLETLAQLAACLRGEYGHTRGIGRKTWQELKDALARARPVIPPGESETPPGLGDTSLRGRLRAYGDLPVECLGRLQTRARQMIERHKLEIIDQLAVWLERVDVADEPNYGRSTHRWLLERMEELIDKGPTQLMFGREVTPTRADELYELFIARLDSDDLRQIFDGYLLQRRTLEDIAQSQTRPVTRERIRQILEQKVAIEAPAWRDRARSILAPTEQLLEAGAGVAPLDSCMALAGATHIGHLELTAQIADRPLTIPSDGRAGVASLLSTDELRRLQGELRELIAEALLLAPRYESAAQQLRTWGVRLPLADEQKLLRDFIGIELHGTTAYLGKRRTHAIYVETLRAAGRALSAQEVAERVAAAYPDTLTSPRNVVVHFARNKFVFNTGKGLWIHIENAGLGLEALERIAEACLSYVPRNGAAVNVRHLLKRLPADVAVPPSLSPFIVRDAMIHTGKIRSWRVGCDVAWRGERDATRTSIPEWIALVTETLPQPFPQSELVDKVEELSGYTRQSIAAQVMQTPGLLALGDGDRVACSAIFTGEAKMEDVREQLCRHIDADEVVTADALVPRLSHLVASFPILGDPRVALGLARTHPDIIGRTLGRLLWHRSLGEDTWSALRRGRSYDLPPAFRIMQVAEWLRTRHRLASEHFAYVLVEEARRDGKLLACGDGWHIDGQLSFAEMVQAVAETPELQRLARCNQDFVRTSPIRDVLNAFRRNHGLFAIKGDETMHERHSTRTSERGAFPSGTIAEDA